MKPRKLPTPKQRADGQWLVRWRHRGPDRAKDGRLREHRRARLFPTQAEANGYILRHLVDESRLSPEAQKTSFKAAADDWLTNKRLDGLRPTTIATYAWAVKVLVGQFGHHPVSTLTRRDISGFRRWLAEQDMAPKTIELVWSVLRATLRHAVQQEMTTTDPAYGSKPPRATKRAERWHFLRPEEISALAAAFPDRLAPYRLMVRFLAYTGLRRSELAGLDLGHLTLSAPTPSHREWSGAVRVAVNLKTKNAKRTVPLPGWLAEQMHEYVSAHPRATDPTAPLWPGTTYRLIDYAKRLNGFSFYTRPFQAAVARAGLPVGLRLHDLRHTYASLLAAAGERAEVVAKLMGHVDASITRRIYTHLWPEHLTDAVARLAAPPVPPPPTTNVVPLRPTGS